MHEHACAAGPATSMKNREAWITTYIEEVDAMPPPNLYRPNSCLLLYVQNVICREIYVQIVCTDENVEKHIVILFNIIVLFY